MKQRQCALVEDQHRQGAEDKSGEEPARQLAGGGIVM
jgi:hypothetical protein